MILIMYSVQSAISHYDELILYCVVRFYPSKYLYKKESLPAWLLKQCQKWSCRGMYSISPVNVAEYKSNRNILNSPKAANTEFEDAMVSDSMTKYNQTSQTKDNRKN